MMAFTLGVVLAVHYVYGGGSFHSRNTHGRGVVKPDVADLEADHL
jgi:hypothetical protein